MALDLTTPMMLYPLTQFINSRYNNCFHEAILSLSEFDRIVG